MSVLPDIDVTESSESTAPQPSTLNRIILPGIEVIRAGHVEPFLNVRPRISSAGGQWGGVALEDYTVPACLIPRHEHLERFLHVALRGSVKYEVSTRGRNLSFTARPGTTFILPPSFCLAVRWMS